MRLLAYAAVVGGVVICACASDDGKTSSSSGAGGGVITGGGGAPPPVLGSGGSSTNGGGASGGTGGGVPALGAPYPLVLAHGFFGFEEFAGLDFATYFFEVKEHLAADGEDLVFTPAVDPFNGSDYRGEQLIAHIEDILAQTGHAKVNIIGHSQGGLDARYVAHQRPDLVASVVTIATPHHGTPIADIATGVIDDPALSSVLNWIVQKIGGPLYDQVGNETDIAAPLNLFSTPGIEAFNNAYTDQPGVFYASIAGRSDGHNGGTHCAADVNMPFAQDYVFETDPIDPFFAVIEPLLDGGFGDPFPNDGLVRVVDARWGEFWGCIPADHLDQVGHLFGDSPGFGNDWRHKPFYRDLVKEIRARGY